MTLEQSDWPSYAVPTAGWRSPVRLRCNARRLSVVLLVTLAAGCSSHTPTSPDAPVILPQPPGAPELPGKQPALDATPVPSVLPEPRPAATPEAPAGSLRELDLAEELPSDPAVGTGTLANGLRYFVRPNAKPENRAELRLVVHAGSLQESDDQRGLAHFVEKMAFNGTKNFEKQALVDYLERVGMRFGPDLNAYTSFGETVYMLQLPTEDQAVLAKGFDILEDWAHNISFEGEEIDRERGVVVEEWRQRQGAGSRIFDQQLPVTYYGSLYAERQPIGSVDILRNSPHEALRRFYQEWYRPDLMAVVAVGDFDAKAVEEEIRKHFSGIPMPEGARPRLETEIPDHDQTLTSIVSDPEATGTRVTVGWKRPYLETKTVGDLRRDLVDELYHTMMIDRLEELTQQADPPYQFAYAFDSPLGQVKSMYQLVASVRDGGLVRGVETMLLEAKRVRDHGFSRPELERGKTRFLRNVERAFEERDKQESRALASRLVDAFLGGEPSPGIDYVHDVYPKLLETITLREVNARADQWMSAGPGKSVEANRVILVSGPESEAAALPSEEQLLSIFAEVDDVETDPWVDKTSDAALVEQPPAGGSIISEKDIPYVDAVLWTLSNGIEVYLKPTTNKNDEVLMAARSAGGHSLVSDEEYLNAAQAAGIVDQMGLGSFGPIELGKTLTGKVVGISPYISELEEGMSGSASPKDLETLFELIYLQFTAPRRDDQAFAAMQSRISGYLENQKASPGYWFAHKYQEVAYGDHPRRQFLESEDVARLDAGEALRIYRERFADPADFDFFFVGSFSLEQIRPLVAKWLGGLPSDVREETWRDIGAYPVSGVHVFTVERGLEPRAQVQVTYSGDAEWTLADSIITSALGETLRIRLREVLREDLGGVYGVGVSAGLSREPRGRYDARISFTADPERVVELLAAARAEIERFKTEGPPQDVIDKVKESWRRGRETQLENNGFWLSLLRNYVWQGLAWEEFDRFEQRNEWVTVESVRAAATRVFDERNSIEGRLVPEASETASAAEGGSDEGSR